MADNENCLLYVAKIFLKPLYGVEVKVVGGLVKKEVVGIAEESLGKHDAYLLVI